MSIVSSVTLAAVLSLFPIENTDTCQQSNETVAQPNQTVENDKLEFAIHNSLQNCFDAPQSQLKWISSIV